MEENVRVLVIEDDPDIVELLTLHLGDLGMGTTSADTGAAGLSLAQAESFSLIILDLMLPGIDGLEICREIRSNDRETPILMLTAKSEELDKVIGLEMGADDYITKPFSTRELVARIKAILRRVKDRRQSEPTEELGEALRFGELTIDIHRRRVSIRDERIVLTAKEYDLLIILATHAGQSFSRQQLLDLVWGYQYEGYSHTVNSHINRLRGKIEADPSEPRYVRTVWGYGYRFAEAEEIEDT